MAQRLQDQPDRFPAARGATVDADVSFALKKLALRSRLRRNRGSRKSRHSSGTVLRGGRCLVGGGRGTTVVGPNDHGSRGPPVSRFRRGELDLDHWFLGWAWGATRRRGFLEKYFSCASRSTCVSSGSRLLSGRTRTTFEFDTLPPAGIESTGAIRSRQFALVFSQKMIAAMLPAFAAANK